MIVSLVSAGQFVANCSEGSFSKVCANHEQIRERVCRFLLKSLIKRLCAGIKFTPGRQRWHSNRDCSANLLHCAIKLISLPFHFAGDLLIEAAVDRSFCVQDHGVADTSESVHPSSS
jgi:hypothetical protein